MEIGRGLLFLCLFVPPANAADTESVPPAIPARTQEESEEDYDRGRIASRDEVLKLVRPISVSPLRIVGYPLHLIDSGLEKGLVSFEENRMREKLYYYQDKLRERGVALLFGGLGEGAGFGGGASYTYPSTTSPNLTFLGNATFRGYQEFDCSWSWVRERSAVAVAISYQWRPQENFYGLGHESHPEDHTQFALRQSWAGVDGSFSLNRRVHVGAGYKQARLVALPPSRSAFSSPEEIFPDLIGFNEHIRLHQVGIFFDADFLRDSYQLGGKTFLEADYQKQLGGNLEYWTYRVDVEGRLPVAPHRSAFVGSMAVELNREQPGSPPLPFFLYSRLGGSSTMRGFPLDRYYGRNLVFATIEYRWALSPDIQALIFFDEGQIFDRTADLTWLNWHRNYGIGIKFRSANASILGLEMGYGEDGINVHLTWGDRVARPLGGPIRYGTYRR